jgi:lipoate-protein ligase A
MAVDQVLLEGARARPTIRVYAWTPPALSLGRFQDAAEIPPELRALDAVRRASGGGAIVHAGELTYSAALPAELCQPAGGRIADSYRLLHDALAAALAAVGVGVDGRPPSRPGARAAARAGGLAPAGADRSAVDPPAFLCFTRRSGFDLTVCGRKLAGSAQRRVRGALLQHGSVPLGIDPDLADALPRAPGSITLAEAAGRPVGYEELARALRRAFAARLGVDLLPAGLGPEEAARAASLAASAFAGVRPG